MVCHKGCTVYATNHSLNHSLNFTFNHAPKLWHNPRSKLELPANRCQLNLKSFQALAAHCYRTHPHLSAAAHWIAQRK